MSDYIVIELNRESYGLPVSETQEIIKLKPITDIPNARPYVRGMINLRGNIVPVVGLRERFQMPAREPDDEMRIVVVKTAKEAVGLLVDRVLKVSSFAEILPPPESVAYIEHTLLTGIGKSDKELVCLLDMTRVLGDGGDWR